MCVVKVCVSVLGPSMGYVWDLFTVFPAQASNNTHFMFFCSYGTLTIGVEVETRVGVEVETGV